MSHVISQSIFACEKLICRDPAAHPYILTEALLLPAIKVCIILSVSIRYAETQKTASHSPEDKGKIVQNVIKV